MRGFGLALLLCAAPLAAEPAQPGPATEPAPEPAPEPPKLQTMIAEGAVGPYRVGMSLTVRDDRQVLAAHYYYASQLTDIALRPGGTTPELVLDEPGGGRFVLHLTNADPSTARPLTYYTSTGLAGTWSGKGKTLPVTLGFGTVLPGTGPERFYADITSASDAAFEAQCRRFLDGVLRGDRQQAVSAMSFPVRVNGLKLTLRNRAQALAQWQRIFTPAALAQLRLAIPHEMFVRDSMAMVANGAVWFDAKGARVLNLP